MKYKWILFDADDTLFHFDAFKGLALMFSRFEVQFTENDYNTYQQKNKPLWVDYQNGKITAKQLQNRRFKLWSAKLSLSTQKLNSAFLIAMADISYLLPGAIDLLEYLSSRAQLGIITNGFAELQKIRLEKLKVDHHFSTLVISEEVGIAKPDTAIFNHAFKQMDNVDKSRILMVGDNIHSDIQGGINAGINTCWLNANSNEKPDNITPNYQITHLSELKGIVTK